MFFVVSTCLFARLLLSQFLRLTAMKKYFFFFIALLAFVIIFYVSIYKLFPSVYLVLQWPRSIKTLRFFVSNFAASRTSFLRRPSHFSCILSSLFDHCHFTTFSSSIHSLSLFLVACTVVNHPLSTLSSSNLRVCLVQKV